MEISSDILTKVSRNSCTCFSVFVSAESQRDRLLDHRVLRLGTEPCLDVLGGSRHLHVLHAQSHHHFVHDRTLEVGFLQDVRALAAFDDELVACGLEQNVGTLRRPTGVSRLPDVAAAVTAATFRTRTPRPRPRLRRHLHRHPDRFVRTFFPFLHLLLVRSRDVFEKLLVQGGDARRGLLTFLAGPFLLVVLERVLHVLELTGTEGVLDVLDVLEEFLRHHGVHGGGVALRGTLGLETGHLGERFGALDLLKGGLLGCGGARSGGFDLRSPGGALAVGVFVRAREETRQVHRTNRNHQCQHGRNRKAAGVLRPRAHRDRARVETPRTSARFLDRGLRQTSGILKSVEVECTGQTVLESGLVVDDFCHPEAVQAGNGSGPQHGERDHKCHAGQYQDHHRHADDLVDDKQKQRRSKTPLAHADERLGKLPESDATRDTTDHLQNRLDGSHRLFSRLSGAADGSHPRPERGKFNASPD
ncbi:MAG: hypothetical protein AMK75_05095 [Planctomycetes bacterium SM23_65]|nr:MAG: hypothetical protein AMK75_05095 [Planctomycetes bacterium SM23_65]